MFDSIKSKIRERYADESDSKIQRRIEEVTIEALCAFRDQLILKEEYTDDDYDTLTCVILGVQDARRRIDKLEN
jgi:hypothetical protein